MSLAMHAVQSIKALRSPQLRTDKQSEVMIDPLAEQVGVGGVVAILMTAAVLKFLPNFLSAMKRNGNGTRSAGRTAEEWDNRIRQAVKDMLFETAPKRHEELERLMEKVLRRELRDFREELRRR